MANLPNGVIPTYQWFELDDSDVETVITTDTKETHTLDTGGLEIKSGVQGVLLLDKYYEQEVVVKVRQ